MGERNEGGNEVEEKESEKDTYSITHSLFIERERFEQVSEPSSPGREEEGAMRSGSRH